MKKIILFIILIAVILGGTYFFYPFEETKEITYNPIINPEVFSGNITNPYFSLPIGKKMIYESVTEEGIERVETYVTNQTKTIMGIKAVVVWDRVWLDEDLIEETFDWYSQDSEGNVWYLGEDSKEYEDGEVVSTKGSWEYGVDGALPGIVMKANPKVGDSYRQEYYKGEAEDMAEVLSLNESVSVPFGEFNNCLKTSDYTPLEPDVKEQKYYCKEVKGTALELDGAERVELISVEYI